jgi:hypothetical protein
MDSARSAGAVLIVPSAQAPTALTQRGLFHSLAPRDLLDSTTAEGTAPARSTCPTGSTIQTSYSWADVPKVRDVFLAPGASQPVRLTNPQRLALRKVITFWANERGGSYDDLPKRSMTFGTRSTMSISRSRRGVRRLTAGLRRHEGQVSGPASASHSTADPAGAPSERLPRATSSHASATRNEAQLRGPARAKVGHRPGGLGRWLRRPLLPLPG